MTKKLTAILFCITLSTTFLTSNTNAEENTKLYKTCKELNVDYKSGVKKTAETKNKVVDRKTKKESFTKSNAKVDSKVYEANKKLDLDNDGIACEK